ncbi:MAG: hypothetical protein RIT24_2026 [Planctomycetota bacterium]
MLSAASPRLSSRNRILVAITLAAAVAGICHARPNGDECSNALIAVVGPNGPVNTATMTPSVSPPANEGCTYLNWSGSNDVWYRFNAPVDGSVSLSFCGSSFDTSVVFYQGSCGALTRIGCDDDGCTTASNYQSAITDLPVVAGPVFIRIGGYAGQTGLSQFDLSFTPAASFGTLYSAGDSQYGQSDAQPSLGYIKSISANASAFHALAIRADGTVYAWGANEYNQCSVPAGLSDVKQVAAGTFFSLALRSTGTVAYWGSTTTAYQPPAGLADVRDIGVGRSHSIALRFDGSVVCWGDNTYGQTTVPAGLPNPVDVDACDNYSLAARADGLVASWGNSPAPPPATAFSVVNVAAGGTFAGALRVDGTVVCWGQNYAGQCNVPAGLVDVARIAAGTAHMLALKSDGTVVAWGNNGYGQLVTANAAAPYAAIAAGKYTSHAISRGDCNSNGVLDGTEVWANDCNGNGRPDCWDFESGFAEDCNANGLADQCEKQLYVLTGWTGSPIGFGSSHTMVIPSAAPAVGSVELQISARGDFSGDLEYVTLRCGTLFERNILAGSGDCVNIPTSSIYMTAEQFNDGIGAGGSWRMEVVPSSAVNAALCPTGTSISIVAMYTAANSADCDLNGELDSCQIAAGTVPDTNGNGIIDTCETLFDACPTDIDNDSVTGASDLALLLGGWGTTDPNLDVDHDGFVGASDLALLLGAWGICPAS